MSEKSILVTGGAGYIGSHVVMQLGEAGENVITLDNLSTGFKSSVKYGELVVGDTGDKSLVSELLKSHDIDTIMHFAAHTIVPESVSNPLKYYRNNTCATRNLLECARDAKIRHFIFSSTAAVYGIPASGRCAETSATNPINPYGTSKLMSEQMLRDLSAASEMRHVILRYFNVAGADPAGRIGQSTEKATLLVKVACETASGKRPYINIFGTNFDTPDGTGVRDYIHVTDLADAHVSALKYLRESGKSQILNCGYGRGFSVREVLNEVERLSGTRLDIRESEPRAGDPPELVADVERIGTVLKWRPKNDSLEAIVSSSLRWEKKV